MYLIWRGLRRSDTFGFCSGSRSVVCGWKVGIVNGRNRAVVLLEQDQYQTGSALHLHETYWYSSIDTYPQNLIYRGTLSPQLRPRESSRTQRLPLVPVRCAVPSIPVHHHYDTFVEQLPWHSAFQPTSPLKILQCRNSRGPCKPSPADGRTHAHPLTCYIIQTFATTRVQARDFRKFPTCNSWCQQVGFHLIPSTPPAANLPLPQEPPQGFAHTP